MLNAFKKPEIGFPQQICAGLYLSMGAFLAIESKSWSPFFGAVLFGLFMSMPSISLATIRRGGHWRSAGIAVAILFGSLLLWACAGVAERLYFLHGDTYPAWLSNGDLGSVKAAENIYGQVEHLCGHSGPRMIDYKSHGQIVLRCDPSAFWPFTRTYVGHQGDAQ
ncbi:hypothetical protein [Paraburkholderia sp. SIMBA_054]|uniref:hypothetical protein n=1 Tax=Paraburkholderia sp. SIMBA_054 TaxID=3085795 RepID=UPI00397D1EFD